MKYLLTALAGATALSTASADPIHVGPLNFVRAETDRYMQTIIDRGELGDIFLGREPVDLDHQTVIRMNLDTLYSSGVFDMEAGPVTVTLPETPDGRYISAQILTEDHYTVNVFHEGTHTFSADDLDTRYAVMIVRVFADSTDPADIAFANTIQDEIVVEQAGQGEFIVPEFDQASLDATRMLLLRLGAQAKGDLGIKMGTREEVDPVGHLIATAFGWGLLPPDEAYYFGGGPVAGEESEPHELVLKDVPTEAFWSVTMYNARGFMVPNELEMNALNNVNAEQNSDGSYRIQLGGCEADTVNCLPTPDGWNYVIRAYKPGEEILSGNWTPPGATPIE